MARRVLHLDAFSGAAGNMFMGALLDLGLSRKALLESLEPLGLDFKLVVKNVQRSGFAARYVDVKVPVSAKQKKAEAKAHAQGHAHGHAHEHEHEGGHGHGHGHDYAHASDGKAKGHTHAQSHGRRYKEIRQLIKKAKLKPAVKARSLEIFEALAKAEAKVHGSTVDDVHFHEVGAVDAIVDVTAAAVGLT